MNTTKESRSELLIIVVFQCHSVIGISVSELYSRQISFAGKTFTVGTENTQAGERRKIIGNYFLASS